MTKRHDNPTNWIEDTYTNDEWTTLVGAVDDYRDVSRLVTNLVASNQGGAGADVQFRIGDGDGGTVAVIVPTTTVGTGARESFNEDIVVGPGQTLEFQSAAQDVTFAAFGYQ